jgi:hypothetical protein
MQKVMAVVRSLYLIFIVGFAARGLPLFWSVTRTFDEQYARCSNALKIVQNAAWLSIAWIALETAVGWWMVARGRAAALQARPAGPQGPAQG